MRYTYRGYETEEAALEAVRRDGTLLQYVYHQKKIQFQAIMKIYSLNLVNKEKQ